jgi:hypothetical protein
MSLDWEGGHRASFRLSGEDRPDRAELDVQPLGDMPKALTPGPADQDLFHDRFRDRPGCPELLPERASPGDAGLCSLEDELSFELRQGARHVSLQSSAGGRSVDPLVDDDHPDPRCVGVIPESESHPEGATEPVYLGDDHGFEPFRPMDSNLRRSRKGETDRLSRSLRLRTIWM